MKKQFFTLVMMLAIIVFAGSSAMAQTTYGTDDVNNTDIHRFIMIAGSSHEFHVTPGDDANTRAWTVWTDAATPVDVSASTAVVNSSSGANGNDFTLEWARSAFGQYFVQFEETDATNATTCQVTTRRFYVTIIDFDIYVYASNSTGGALTGGQLTACGEGTTANYGDIGTAGSADAFSNEFNGTAPKAGETMGDLIAYTGEDPRTLRHISFQVIWNVSNANNSITVPTVGSMTFDYAAHLTAVTGTYTENTNLESVNGNPAASATASLVTLAANASAPVVGTASTIPGPVGTIDVLIDDRWNSTTTFQDLSFYLRASNITLYSGDDATTTRIGTEPTTYEAGTTLDMAVTQASNNSAAQIIQLAPATSIITVD